MTFNPNLEVTETTRISGTLEARTVTPYARVLTPKPPSRQAWSSYKVDGDQYTLDTLAKGTYSPQPPDIFRDTIISHRPGSKFGTYETSKTFDTYQETLDAFRNQNQQKYDPEKEEMIRDFLTRKEIESYEREIENEKRKLQKDTQRMYEDHLQNMTSKSGRLHETAASNAVKAHIAKTVPPGTPLDMSYNGRLSTKPPVPKPPHCGHVQYPRTPHPRRGTPQCHRASRPTSAALHRGLDNTMKMDEMLTTKRVVFQTPRPGSASGREDRRFLAKKGEHFSQWRGAVSPALNSTHYGDDQLWKMSRFTKSAHPRISTRWNPDSRIGSGYRDQTETGKVNVNVECPEGDNMDVELSISRSPNKVY